MDDDWVVLLGHVSYAEGILARGLIRSAGLRAELRPADNRYASTRFVRQPQYVDLLVLNDEAAEAATLLPDEGDGGVL